MMNDNNVGPLHPSEWTENTLRAQLTRDEFDPAEFDLPAMLTRLNNEDATSWFDLIHDHHVARRTTVGCPDWCGQPKGHLFNMAEPGEPQQREHILDLTPEDVEPAEDYLETVRVEVLLPELRQGTDDATATTTLPHLWLNIEGSFTADGAAKIAAALLTASHKMREMEQH